MGNSPRESGPGGQCLGIIFRSCPSTMKCSSPSFKLTICAVHSDPDRVTNITTLFSLRPTFRKHLRSYCKFNIEFS